MLQFFTSNVQCVHLAAEDALKPVMPLTNRVINEMLRQSLEISQGTGVTHLRCCGIFSTSIIRNFLLILTMK